jgi:26-hydroxylase
MGEFFQETVEGHRSTFDPENIRDLVDTYLVEIEKAKVEGRATHLFEGKSHGNLIAFKINDRDAY